MNDKVKIIEHEPEIVTTHGTFKQGQKVGITTARAEREKENYCPLMCRKCQKNCAYNDGDGCILVTGGDLQDGLCPFNPSRSCNDNCALYDNDNCIFILRR